MPVGLKNNDNWEMKDAKNRIEIDYQICGHEFRNVLKDLCA